MKSLNLKLASPEQLQNIRKEYFEMLDQLPLKDRIPFVKSFYEEVAEKYIIKVVKESELLMSNFFKDFPRYSVTVEFGKVDGMPISDERLISLNQYTKRIQRIKKGIKSHSERFSEASELILRIISSFKNNKTIKVQVSVNSVNELIFSINGLSDENIIVLKESKVRGLVIYDDFLSESSHYFNKAVDVLVNANAVTTENLNLIINQLKSANLSSLSNYKLDRWSVTKTIATIEDTIKEIKKLNSHGN